MKFVLRCLFTILCLAGVYFVPKDLSSVRRSLAFYQISGYGDELLDIKGFENLRYLAFGTSKTWGAQLADRTKAYPWLLSPNATNLAIRASGPRIPSLCTYSLVGDEVYDVIILEYYFMADNSLIRLVHRLRHRFPKATFIFLKIWSPVQFRLRYNVESRLTDLVASQIRPEEFTMDKYHQIVEKYDSKDWLYSTRHQADLTIQRIANEVGGHIISPTLDPLKSKPYLHKFAPLYVHDTIHFSEYGHRWMRNAILTILKEEKVTRHEDVQPWESKDSCNNWYENDELRDTIYDPKLVYNNFGPEKHALELHTKSAWITASNKMDKKADVFLSYMTRGPTIKNYPIVMVQLAGNKPITIDPNLEETVHPFAVHLNEQIYLGTAPPGNSKITITELKGNKDPFRVTGILVTPPLEKVIWWEGTNIEDH